MTTTINISLPKALYDDAKKHVTKRRYTSVSELIREALRSKLYPELTENGFTREFEDKVLEAEKEKGPYIVWDGKTPFSKFVLKQGKKQYDEN